MFKIKPILYCLLFFIVIFFYLFNYSYASLAETIQNIENEIIDETKLEQEWLEPNDNEDSDKTNSLMVKSRGEGVSLLGDCNGLTYYSQADKRWANRLYTSTNNPNQTMKSSGCGPTAAAIVVSSCKGSILPTKMANIFVREGFRTANSGTSWNAFPFIANYFAFNNYQYTTNLNTAINNLKNGSIIIVSCGNGLFTTNGHYIVLVGIKNNTISIYDTYLYNGKFDIPNRKGKVKISGNTIYCTIDNFKKYANYRAFWCYSNDSKQINNSNNVSTPKYSVGTYQVATKRYNLRIRKGPGTTYKIVGRLKKGTKISINRIKDNWGHLSNNRGWIYLGYCKKIKIIKYSSGTYKVTASALRVRSGPGTNYKIKSRVYKNSIQKIDYTKGNWGHLTNNTGWICLDYCVKIK